MRTSRYLGIRRQMYLALGLLSLAAGVIGIFLPVWPTTCFLLLAAGCCSRSSERLHAWMHSNRWFGAHLRRYREDGSIDRRIRNLSLVWLWASLAASAAFLGMHGWAVLLLSGVGSAISFHLLRLPVRV